MSFKRLIVIIPAAQQAKFNADAEAAFSGDTDKNTFTVGLNPSGLETLPATHYWCSWGGLTDQQFDALGAVFGAPARFFESDNDLEFRLGYPPEWQRAGEVLAVVGLKVRESILSVGPRPSGTGQPGA